MHVPPALQLINIRESILVLMALITLYTVKGDRIES